MKVITKIKLRIELRLERIWLKMRIYFSNMRQKRYLRKLVWMTVHEEYHKTGKKVMPERIREIEKEVTENLEREYLKQFPPELESRPPTPRLRRTSPFQ